MLRFHRERGAGATLAVLEIDSEEASRFGVLEVDERIRLTGFLEKPKHLAPRQTVLASMGIYIFDMNVLVPTLEADAARSTDPRFRQGHHSGPDQRSQSRVPLLRRERRGRTRKYWRHRHPSMRTSTRTSIAPRQSGLQPVQSRVAPPNGPGAGAARRSSCSPTTAAATARRSTRSSRRAASGQPCLGKRAVSEHFRVHSFCEVDQSILMPGCRVGRHAKIRRAIIDRDVFIPRGARIGYNADEDRSRHTVTDSGIVVVTTEDQPFVGIPEEALRNEAEFNRSRHHPNSVACRGGPSVRRLGPKTPPYSSCNHPT